MPADPIQLVLAAFEYGLLLFGVFLLGMLVVNASFRARWWHTNRLASWSVALPEFALYLLAFFAAGSFFLLLVRSIFGTFIQGSADKAGMEVIFYGAALDGGALTGWLLFPVLRKAWHTDYGVSPPGDAPSPVIPGLGKSLLYGIGTVALSLPVIIVLSLGWTPLLKALGLPDVPQDSIAIFANTKSPAVIAGMLVVACGLAPMMEELLFRAGIYRFCRQKLGRGAGLAISGILFGLVHGNWAGFVPLAFLGAMLAMVYEATGSIRVAIIAHAFFNLNSILAILSGLKL